MTTVQVNSSSAVFSPRGKVRAPSAVQRPDWRHRLETLPAPPAWSPRTGEAPPAQNQSAAAQAGTMAALTAAALVANMVAGEHLQGLGNWAYVGAFGMELLDAATPLAPTPAHAYVYSISEYWNPVIVAALAALGSTIGETVGFMIGTNSARSIRGSSWFKACTRVLAGWEGRMVTALSALPLPVYLGGVWAGALGLAYRRYFLCALAGKLVLFGILAVLGFLQA